MLSRQDKTALSLAGLTALLAIFALPYLISGYALLQLTLYAVLSILALSLAFIWGTGGILSFGHAVFFGLGAYAYALAAINFGETTAAVALSIVVPALFAAILGYFLFYGRISDVYLGAITLTVTLIFFNLANSTSGPQYKIGKAALGGFNGIPAIPRLNVPGVPGWTLNTTQLFGLTVALLALTYAGLLLLIRSDFGRILFSIKDNEARAELLGYDARRYKLIAFVIGGGIAGLAGCLYANWGGFISPSVFAVSQSVQVIIWVVVGGVGSLAGAMLGCIAVQWLTNRLGAAGLVNSNLVLGLLLTVVVVMLPEGFVPTLKRVLSRFLTRKGPSPAAGQSEKDA
jgi:ABC-type branched-subunit amino acid transport system permease subunit